MKELIIDFGKRRHLLGETRDQEMINSIDEYLGKRLYIPPNAQGDINHIMMNHMADVILLIRQSELMLLGQLDFPSMDIVLGSYDNAVHRLFNINRHLLNPELNKNTVQHLYQLTLFLRKHLVYKFNPLWGMIPLTKGFAKVTPEISVDDNMEDESLVDNYMMSIALLKSGYLEPMTRYIGTLSSKAKSKTQITNSEN